MCLTIPFKVPLTELGGSVSWWETLEFQVKKIDSRKKISGFCSHFSPEDLSLLSLFQLRKYAAVIKLVYLHICSVLNSIYPIDVYHQPALQHPSLSQKLRVISFPGKRCNYQNPNRREIVTSLF